MMTIFGTLGIGAVWGWLLILTAGRNRTTALWHQSRPILFALLLASVALGTTITLLTDSRHWLYFGLAALTGAAAHQTLLARIQAGLENS